MQVIPAIDLHRGRCVRLFQGRYDQVTYYPQDPVEQATRYRNQGATLLHVVDLDGAKSGGGRNSEIIRDMAAIQGLELQSGGGIRNEIDVRTRFELGVDRLVVGSLSVTAAKDVAAWLRHYGSERFILALDIRYDKDNIPRVATHGWQEQTETSLWDAIEFFGTELQHVLCTDISRDGTMTGPRLELYRECVKRYPSIWFQASGGVRDHHDIRDLAATGVAAAITGKALLEEKLKLEHFMRSDTAIGTSHNE